MGGKLLKRRQTRRPCLKWKGQHHRRRRVLGNDAHVVKMSWLGLFPPLIWVDYLRWSQETVFDVLFNQSRHVGDVCGAGAMLTMNPVSMPFSYQNSRFWV